MKRAALLATVVLTALMVSAIVFLTQPMSNMIVCDGAVPTWMIEAQGYDGGGCAYLLPSSEAPPNADWTPYCLMCPETP